jgi:uncharacterized protein (TIGR03435 family)
MTRASLRWLLVGRLMLGLVAVAEAQTPQFEVASIKPNNSGDNGSATTTNDGEVIVRNNTLRQLIQNAFDVRSFSFSGPDWLTTVRFDITAKLARKATFAEMRLLMQALRVERFGLAVHHETKTIQGYALVTAKNGPKIQPVEDNGGHPTNSSRGKIVAERMTMAQLADTVSRQLRQPISDLTGLKGVYTFTLTYTPDTGDEKATGKAGPSIYTARQEQLGLRLEARKIPVDTVVVDHVERTPTEN